MSRFQFVADHRDTFEVKRLCEVIEVNRSSFYAWDAAAEARAGRAAADAELAERIRVVHEADKAYGAPRVTAELNDRIRPEQRVNRKRVARVMAGADTGPGTFLTETEARALLDGLQLLRFHVQDHDGMAFSGPKHWHVFDVIARRPAT